MTKTIECIMLYPLKSFLAQMAFTLVGTFSTIGLSRWFHEPIIGVLGFVIFFIIPAFYHKPFKKPFTKRVVFTFDDVDINVSIFNLQNDELEESFVYQYQDIQSYTTNATQPPYSSIILKLNNNDIKRFTFFDDDGVNSSELIRHQIAELAINSPHPHQIKKLPHFYNTKLGSWLILILGIAMALFFIFTLFYWHKALPLSCIGTIALFGLILLRYNKNRLNA